MRTDQPVSDEESVAISTIYVRDDASALLIGSEKRGQNRSGFLFGKGEWGCGQCTFPLGKRTTTKTRTAGAMVSAFLSAKERADHALLIKLRIEGIIKTRGAPFEESDERELSSLAERGVYNIKDYDKRIHGKIRKFNSWMVYEIKGKITIKPYEKS
jgi:hypothetical protein